MPHPRTKVSLETRQEMLKRADAGESYHDLAAAYGISRQRIQILHQRSQDPIWRLPPTNISEIQFAKLCAELEKNAAKRPKKGWSQDHVRQLAYQLFHVNLDMRHRRGDLRVNGVQIGAPLKKDELSTITDPGFRKYLASPIAETIREREKIWHEAELERQKNYKPRLGRPRKNPLPEPAPGTQPTPATAPDDDEDDGFDIGSIEDMERSVAETRAKLAAQGIHHGPGSSSGPALTPWQRQQQQYGIRTGKHARSNQHQQKKKKKRR